RISKTYFSMQNSMKQEPCDFSHGRFSIVSINYEIHHFTIYIKYSITINICTYCKIFLAVLYLFVFILNLFTKFAYKKYI
ncbi:TPA: hypothetical protein JD078_14205, partial [Clostridioides difficile]|nr:hypothetical protein [Clostridioides difficile]